MKYLFRELDHIKKIFEKKYLLIFCDFDGTLAPIAETPDKAAIPKKTKELLIKLSKITDCKIVIISGRDVKDLKAKILIKNVVYSGSHGLKIDGFGFKFKAIVSQKQKNVLKTIKNILEDKLKNINGILLEDKEFSICIHYRLVNKKNISVVNDVINDVISLYEKNKAIKTKHGKKVLEIMTPVKWDKGKAALRILRKQRDLLKKKEVFPVYFGDDKTDEDAFNVLKNKGLTVFVGKSKLSTVRITKSKSGKNMAFSHPPRRTLNSSLSKAGYYLNDTEEVAKMLEYILQIRK